MPHRGLIARAGSRSRACRIDQCVRGWTALAEASETLGNTAGDGEKASGEQRFGKILRSQRE